MLPSVCEAVDISAKSACLIVADSGETIYEKDCDLTLPMASTTKMMTALIAAESGKWEETVTVSVNAQNQEGSSIYLRENDRIKLSDLVCGMMLNSGNDAAVATAEHIAGSCDSFARIMTERAKELGAKNTSFQNPSGLDADNHYSTAHDLALIGSEVIRNEKLSEIIKSKEMQLTDEEGNITYLRNHNKLLWSYDGMIGIKTGFTKKSGRCLVTAAEREGVTLIAVTLSAPDDWADHKKLLDYGFDMCERRTIVEQGEELKEIEVDGERLALVAAEDIPAVNVKRKREEINLEIKCVNNLSAPVKEGEKLGVVRAVQNGKAIGETYLIAQRSIYEGEPKEKGIRAFLRGFLIN